MSPWLVEWTVQNQGASLVGTIEFAEEVYLSEDAIFDQDDRHLANTSLQHASLASTATYTQGADIPTEYLSQYAAGDYYVIVRADAWNSRSESDESNNWLAVPFTLTAPDVDLTVVDFVAPPSITAGEALDVQWLVRNQGSETATARNSNDALYLTEDGTRDTIVRYLSGTYVEAGFPLGAGQRYDAQITVPGSATTGNFSPGQYFLTLQIDQDDTQAETNNSNNIFSVPLEITGADLVLESAEAPATVALGASTTVTWTVGNQDTNCALASWQDRLYVSQDTQLDATDIQVVTVTAADTPLPPGASYTQQRQVTLSASLPAGDQYLLVVADGSSQQVETNEDNNVLALSIRLEAPDLIVTDMSAPSEGAAGETLDVSWSVLNQGSVRTGTTWGDVIFLSRDSQRDSTDTYLRTIYNQGAEPLESGESYAATTDVTLPVALQSGAYYLIASADHWNGQNETDNDNNWLAVPITVGLPDLAISQPSAPSTAAVGTSVELSWTVDNISAAAARGNWTDAVYLSADTVFDPFDKLVGSFSRPEELATGAAYTKTESLVLPTFLPSGNQYLIFITDSTRYRWEEDEQNNTASLPISIVSSELQPISLDVPLQVTPGERFDVQWSARNSSGQAIQGNWLDRLYLSDDQRLDGGDISIASRSFGDPLEAVAMDSQSVQQVYISDGDAGQK